MNLMYMKCRLFKCRLVKISKYVLKILLIVWGKIPILAYTNNDFFWFGNITSKKYLTFINITLGIYRIEVKFTKNNCFNIFSLEKHYSYQINSELEANLRENLLRHYSTLSKAEFNIEKEALLSKYNINLGRQSISYQKINFLITLSIGFITLAITKLDFFLIFFAAFEQISFLTVILVAFIYSFTNLLFIFYQATKTRSFGTMKFSDLKSSTNKEFELFWHIYYDWQQVRRKADYFASFLEYGIKWLIITLVILFFIFLLISKKVS